MYNMRKKLFLKAQLVRKLFKVKILFWFTIIEFALLVISIFARLLKSELYFNTIFF